MLTTTKFQSYVLTITTFIVYTLWFKYNEYIQINPYLKLISTSLLSLGLYKLITILFLAIFQRIRLVRKFFLGPKYLEGTWVGFYIGIGGSVRFIVEHFEQDFEILIVRGRAYNDQKKFHTSWISYPANIDIVKGELTYMYELKGAQQISNGTGIVYFNFYRKNQISAPTMISGFSADLENKGVRTKSLEHKISDDVKITDSQALTKAIEFYNLNKDNF
ncbi:hypothetical protein EXU85_13480 [Spirosoma sp. KCTC 42546]|uniref:hypothetical protein n=1 Tax=Spirosoma sp. KCTC 42546 TaxID=2520506 RepID=UPI00115943FB|nr:hypothetical protein [Spirosoma sp. KCTC 42546]QDK79559.1 hypothetical protein EXU85_13480 [Spirosoma sp. KCTC 42546]